MKPTISICVFLILLAGRTALAGSYVGETGSIGEIRYASYFGYASCVKVNDTWFRFDKSDSGDPFLTSMVLAASASKQEIHAGANTDSLSTDYCNGLTT